MRVFFKTFGCKANQYDTERMRQELEALGARASREEGNAQICVVNTCTVTNQADADARRYIRRVQRENPGMRVVVAGCSSALKPEVYEGMEGVAGVVEGHDPLQVARATFRSAEDGPLSGLSGAPPLVQLRVRKALDRTDHEPLGGDLLNHRAGGTRGWLKIQDGCDRQCSFCATRLARGPSRSRSPEEILREARLLGRTHPELVLTGIHIGHYGRDLTGSASLARLVAELLEGVPGVRFRLGSVEATEVDDPLLELLAASGGALAPHLHMPLQSGADPVLRRMRRWHTREMYRARALEIAERLPVLGLGADIITGFPGETDEDHARTRALVEELPFTYLHVFPFSPRDDTVAAGLPDPVPQRVAGERSRDLRELAREKGNRYRARRSGDEATVVLEGQGGRALTEDYLRVEALNPQPGSGGLSRGRLMGGGENLRIDLSPSSHLIERDPSTAFRDRAGTLLREPGESSNP
ncbi:MAG: MiaB/RimO family radical SAM methylthiotransferase [Gemmatimonadota bacterium]